MHRGFWDLLLADAQPPDLPSYKPARHALLDLAFGGPSLKKRGHRCQLRGHGGRGLEEVDGGRMSLD